VICSATLGPVNRPTTAQVHMVFSGEGKQVAQAPEIEPRTAVPTWSEEPCRDQYLTPPRASSTVCKNEVTDLYAVGVTGGDMAEQPFIHEVQLHGPKGEVI
jgi:hypothetical protein